MNHYIDELVDRVQLPIRYGHPCLYDALRLAASIANPQSYLEIGVHDGASLLAVMTSSPNLSRITLCDLVRRVHELPERMNYHGSLTFLHGDSYELIPTLPKDQLYDLTLVDGDHSLIYAMADIKNTFPLTRPGGIFIVDDSSRPEVREACEFLEHTERVTPIIYMHDPQDAVTVYRKGE